MPRLIDATPIEKTDGWLYGTVLVIPKQLIYDALTVDAVPAVHGHWDDGCCSVCKLMWDEDMVMRGWDDGYWETKTGGPKYCPNCGAKMDEKEGKRNENCV